MAHVQSRVGEHEVKGDGGHAGGQVLEMPPASEADHEHDGDMAGKRQRRHRPRGPITPKDGNREDPLIRRVNRRHDRAVIAVRR